MNQTMTTARVHPTHAKPIPGIVVNAIMWIQMTMAVKSIIATKRPKPMLIRSPIIRTKRLGSTDPASSPMIARMRKACRHPKNVHVAAAMPMQDCSQCRRSQKSTDQFSLQTSQGNESISNR